MKFVQVPAEFSLSLFATEPDIVKPIAFAFDERGRMWIAETVDYPNEPTAGKPGDDRIRILEDTNGDGKADKFTVFADQLNIPTSLVFANGGVIVAQPPHILFLKDTNGDDKADERKILSTGWGQSDTHAILSNLQYGMDNYIWGVVGYSGFKGEINGKQFAFAQAAFRFRPDGSDFEVMTGSTNNTWGLGFTETFDVFGSTANNDPSFYMAIPNRFFEGVEGLPTPGQRGVGSGYQSLAAFYAVHPLTPYIRQVDVFNGYTAGAGHYSLHGAVVPEGVLEPHRVHQRADRAPHRPGHHREAGRGVRHARRVEPRGRRRRVVRARPHPGRTGRRRVVLRLVQLHHPAQPDAAGLQQRSGKRLRVAVARSSPRPHLSHRLQERGAVGEAIAVGEGHGRAAERAGLRQHAVAPHGAATDHRARTEGRRAAAGRPSSRTRRSTRSASTAARCTRCGR